MIRNLRILYLSRPAREKVMILALVILGALFWLSGFARRAGDFIAEARKTTGELKTQSQWLSNRDRIERNARDEEAQLDTSQTLDGSRLTAAVQSLASDTGIQANTSAPEDSQGGGQFVIHSMQVNINHASWDAIQPFYFKLQARAPYISIETLSMMADKGNPAFLSVSLRVSSVEIMQHS